MATKVKLTERDLAQLEQLHERALTCRALENALKEAELERNELIVELVDKLPRGSGPRIGEAANLTRAWPGKLRDLYPARQQHWRAEHPDRLALLLEARNRLDLLIEEVGDGDR